MRTCLENLPETTPENVPFSALSYNRDRVIKKSLQSFPILHIIDLLSGGCHSTEIQAALDVASHALTPEFVPKSDVNVMLGLYFFRMSSALSALTNFLHVSAFCFVECRSSIRIIASYRKLFLDFAVNGYAWLKISLTWNGSRRPL